MDCLIIGGGPAGLLAATYLARYRRRVVVIDAGCTQIPESHNHPGFTGISGAALLSALANQAGRYGATIMRGDVTRLQRGDRRFFAHVDGTEFSVMRILLATGITDNSPDLPGLDRAVARAAIRYCPVCDGYEALDAKVAVYGPMESAMSKALFMRTYTRQLMVLPTVASPNAPGELVDAGIAVAKTPPERFWQTPAGIGVQLASGERLEFAAVYPALGCNVHSELAVSLGAECNTTGLLRVDDQQRTTIEGLYAAGDVVSDLHQLSVAEGHAAVAATAIHASLPRNFR